MFEKKWTDRVSAHLTHIEAAREVDEKLFNDVFFHLRQSMSRENNDTISKANGVATIFYRDEPACSFKVDGGEFTITSPKGRTEKRPIPEAALELLARLMAESVDRYRQLEDAA